MSIYFDYLSDYERSVFIESTEIENEFSKLQSLYEMTCLQISQIEKEIEHKVFAESGTYDDFTYLLQEAGNEVVEKKKGIIARIIDAIKRLFAKLTGKSNDIRSYQIPPETMISVPADLEEKSIIITNTMNKMKTGIAKLQNGDFTGAYDIIKVAAAPVALVTITGGVVMKQIQKRKGDEITANMDNAKNFFNGIWDKISAKIHSLSTPKDVDDANACLNPIQKILSAINSIFDGLKNGITNSKGNEKPEDNAQEQKPEDNAQEQKSRQLAKNNVLEKPAKNGGKYLIDRTTGNIRYLNSAGTEIPIKGTDIPRDVIKAAQQVKGKAAAMATVAKQKSIKDEQVNSKKIPDREFTPTETGVKVKVDGTTAKVFINGKIVTEPLPYGVSEAYATKIFKKYGVTKKRSNIYYALRAAQEGIQNSKREQRAINKQEEKIAKQNRTVAESICDLINDVLTNTVLEAVIENDCISLIEYTIDPQTLSEESIQTLENVGYTVEMTDKFYEIYE